MDARQRRLYTDWSQSDRISLSASDPNGASEIFLVSGDLLRRRSRKFREALTQFVSGMPIKVASIETMRDFFIWTHSPQPHIEEQASLEDVVKLGIFAAEYEIPALSNQITDVIRSNLASGEWKLQASIADNIYDVVPAGEPLREVIRGTLGRLPRSIADLEEDSREEWKATILKHSQLGWDYIEASGSDWTRQSYLAGVCQYHDHKGMAYQNGFSASCDGCPYAQDECYPEWKQEESIHADSLTDEAAAAEFTEPAASSGDTFRTAPVEPALAPIEEEPASEAEPAVVEVAVDEEPAEAPVEDSAVEPPEAAPEVMPANESPAEEAAQRLPEPEEPAQKRPAVEDTLWTLRQRFRDPIAPADKERPLSTDSLPRDAPETEDERPREDSLDRPDDEDPAASEVNDVAPSEISHSGSGSTEVNGVKSTQINGTTVPEAVIEEVDGPIERNGHLADEKDVQESITSVAADTETTKSAKKKNKKKRNSVSHAKH
ncbi:hypothetical protein LTR10_015248 [Elasticomyces elasticus]|uniref:BTB domain-containing protein n=1 Tax=Exophiala sideris TaxID=1016849 RepID=A0ABR0JE79_9EURO|nr:hypothetical protein LTR10_015248 [Elasticomyces elasticus]KAK5032723.1 hypothetical protein LTS07_004133 [Exophiala sideris]KAK5037097.1 hypothetical protein LTR13_004902 [Exophiala sideris]KAK5062247.1 hypothetical protein LTR69_004605 [Exophiala sideris]KAK5182255.1 hypothetical protein LTR44_005266 [Eurotiomycetes sp. CCFEE 6388]